MLTFADILERPYFYRATPFALDPRLADEIAYVVRRNTRPFYRYECLMLGAPGDYGPGRRETGENFGFGAAFGNPAEALAKSVFEAWERKFSKAFDPAALVVGTYNELVDRAVDPSQFSLVSDWEFAQSPLDCVRFKPELLLSWKECYRVEGRTLKSALIPATLVYSRFSWKNSAERFAPNLSPGLACHATLREAFLTGLCELVERDAFMLAWLRRRSPPRIQPETIAFDEAEETFQFLQATGFGVHFLDLTTNLGIPVIATLIEHGGLPWEGTFVVGLGCELDPQAALRKSLLEALVMLANHVAFEGGGPKLLERRELRFGLKAANYFPKARFLFDGDRQVALDEIACHDRHDPGKNLEFLIDHLNALGHATYFVDLTPPGYENCRICLTRAFIAGLQPMLYEPDCWRLNARRLFGDGPAAFEKLNLMPHPLMLLE